MTTGPRIGAPDRARLQWFLVVAKALFVVALLVVGFLVVPVDADDDKNPRERRKELASQKAEIAAAVDTLVGEKTDILDALAALEADVATQLSQLEDAERDVEAAQAEIDQATAKLAATEAEVDSLQGEIRDAAVEAFIRPPSDAYLVVAFDAANEQEIERTLLDAASSSDTDLVDRLSIRRDDLEFEREQLDQIRARSAERSAAVTARLDDLAVAVERQEGFAAAVEERIDVRLSEAAAIEDLDKELAAQIAREEAALAAKLKADREAKAKAQASVRVASSGPSACAPRSPSSSRGPVASSSDIVSVKGFRVHRDVAANVEAMITAAENDGIRLGGGGYRDPSGQIAVRKNNCGRSHYAIYEMPASRCRPPTARPGTSMHERGKALDLTYQGSIISSRRSPAFKWLAANAARYGFYNLPSEPWHWSTNGK